MKAMDDKVKYWIDLSDYDLETAEAMLQSGRYLYVGFMCHQSIEKIFKAYFTKSTSQVAPFSHSLAFLAKKGNIFDLLDDKQKEFIDELEPMNIEARYPTHKENVLKSLSFEKCNEIISKTNELHQWIKARL